jgi:predicted  nucleic acid-binding Zn-ribbon protein
MARPKTNDELEALRRQQAALAEKIKDAEAKFREREKEIRQAREALAGRVLLAFIDANAGSDATRLMIDVISKAVVKKTDRELFEFLDEAQGSTHAAPEIAAPAPEF